jgi:glutathione S-transferase
MSSAPSNPALTLYDIKMAPPITTSSCAPNPWKARQALNFKALPFKTTWVDLPDITKTRIALGVPAGRQFADGTDFYTLPVLVNEETGEKIGDSLDIAIYLDENFPDSGKGRLLPEGNMEFLLEYSYKDTDILVPLSGISATASQAKYAPYAHFNRHVDAAFTAHTLLMAYGMKFVPETAEITKTEFARRASMPSFEAFKIEGEPRRATMESFKTALWDLAQFFIRDSSGPFILGAKPCHADFIVGGWLRFAQVCLHPEEWEEVRAWHGGVFGRVFDELGMFREIK